MTFNDIHIEMATVCLIVGGASLVIGGSISLDYLSKNRKFKEVAKHPVLSPSQMSQALDTSGLSKYGIVSGVMTGIGVKPPYCDHIDGKMLAVENTREEDYDVKNTTERKRYATDFETGARYPTGSTITHSWHRQTLELDTVTYFSDVFLSNSTFPMDGGRIKLEPFQFWNFNSRFRTYMPSGFAQSTQTRQHQDAQHGTTVVINNSNGHHESSDRKHIAYYLSQKIVFDAQRITAIGNFSKPHVGATELSFAQQKKKPYYLTLQTPEDIRHSLENDKNLSGNLALGFTAGGVILGGVGLFAKFFR